MPIPHNITVDFSGDGGSGIQAESPGKCMTADLCLFGDISPGDWIKRNPDGHGWVHTLCLARDSNEGLICNQGSDGKIPRNRLTGYTEVHADNKPTRYQGTSIEDMGY